MGAVFIKNYCEISRDKIYLVSINEPTLKAGKLSDLEGFQSCYIPGKECRAAILFKGPGKFDVIFRKDISDHNCVVTIVRIPGKTSFYFISLYLACSTSTFLQDQLDRLDNCLSLLDNSLPIVIFSDTNCRSAQWGDNFGRFSMDRANRLTEFFFSNFKCPGCRMAIVFNYFFD